MESHKEIEEALKNEKLKKCERLYHFNNDPPADFDIAIVDLEEAVKLLEEQPLTTKTLLFLIEYYYHLYCFYEISHPSSLRIQQQYAEKVVAFFLDQDRQVLKELTHSSVNSLTYYLKILRNCFYSLEKFYYNDTVHYRFYRFGHSCLLTESDWDILSQQKFFNYIKELPKHQIHLQKQFYNFCLLISKNYLLENMPLNLKLQHGLQIDSYRKDFEIQVEELSDIINSRSIVNNPSNKSSSENLYSFEWDFNKRSVKRKLDPNTSSSENSLSKILCSYSPQGGAENE